MATTPYIGDTICSIDGRCGIVDSADVDGDGEVQFVDLIALDGGENEYNIPAKLLNPDTLNTFGIDSFSPSPTPSQQLRTLGNPTEPLGKEEIRIRVLKDIGEGRQGVPKGFIYR